MKTIISTNAYKILVDDEDYEQLSKLSWHFSKTNGVTFNSSNWGKNNGPTYQMSRVIMNLGFDDPRIVDHINHNRADNRKCNLRICTQSQNMANRRKSKGMSSKYKGVSRDRSHRKWRVQIRKNGQQTYLGVFKNELDAAAAYDVAALQKYGEFALTNFEMAMMGEI